MEPLQEPGSEPDWFLPSVIAMLPQPVSATAIKLAAIAGGANNRAFRIDAGSQSYFLKWYFASPHDLRDRLRAEWDFSKFAWRHGLRNLAEPVACNADRRLAVFEFLTGRRLLPSQVNSDHIDSAIRFLVELNRHRNSPDAEKLPVASEGCFSIAAHLDCVRQRVQRLEAETRQSNVSPAARHFVEDLLTPVANRVDEQIRLRLAKLHPSFSAELSREERILSPSDFGFHNVMVDANDQLRFFDFEYAGWDDPAKTVCDFFSQIAVPVPLDYWPRFVADIGQIAGASVAQRAEMLRPLYLVKWCCIVLNPIVRFGRERRQFSRGQDLQNTESECLERAQRILASIQE